MTSTHGMRRRLTGFLAILFAAILMTPLAAAPAQAAYGTPQTVSLQVRGYSSTGVETLVGRVVGTVQFDDGNSSFYLSLTLCRQSSYVTPDVKIYVNGSYQYYFSNQDDIRRPEACGGGHGMSGVIVGGFSYGGTIQNLTVTLEGLYFEGYTATYKTKSAFYDNPYN